MTKDFNYHKLEWKDKKRYIIHQIVLFLIIVIVVALAINNTNPVVESTQEKISLTIGGMMAASIIALGFLNRLKKIFEVKFVAIAIIWVILGSFQMIIGTIVWGLGALLIPLMIDDIIMSAYWNKLWYNKYDK